MAPEVWPKDGQAPRYDFKVDSWSVGVTLAYMYVVLFFPQFPIFTIFQDAWAASLPSRGYPGESWYRQTSRPVGSVFDYMEHER